jgi:hypothetical protein
VKESFQISIDKLRDREQIIPKLVHKSDIIQGEVIIYLDDAGTVTSSFKVKTKCIPLYVSGSIFTHKATNSKINSITSVYYTVSLIQNLLQEQEVYTAEQNTTPQAEYRGLAHLKEVFIF